MTQTDELLDVRGAAEMLGVKPGTMHAMRHRGRGPVSWVRGKRITYRRSDVEEFLAQERRETMRGQGIGSA